MLQALYFFQCILIPGLLHAQAGTEQTLTAKERQVNEWFDRARVFENENMDSAAYYYQKGGALNSEQVFDALRAGASGYLLKSATNDSILRSLRELYEGGAPMNALIAQKLVANFRE